MGNETSSVAEIKKRGDAHNKAIRRERTLAGLPAGLGQQMSSKRFKKDDPSAEQWKVGLVSPPFRVHTVLSAREF